MKTETVLVLPGRILATLFIEFGNNRQEAWHQAASALKH